MNTDRPEGAVSRVSERRGKIRAEKEKKQFHGLKSNLRRGYTMDGFLGVNLIGCTENHFWHACRTQLLAGPRLENHQFAY